MQNMIGIILKLFIILLGTRAATPFSSPTKSPSPPWQGFLDQLFPNNANNAQDSTLRSNLKHQLLKQCRENIGKNTPQIRTDIESIISQLAPLNPTPNTATNPLLQRLWKLEWTSEKEINFFLANGISNEIIQTLEGGTTLQNYIPFVKGGGFGVSGDISVDGESEGMLRTKFKFRNANLDLGRWGEYNFPPVGEGWFDTVYLDDELRIDTNSRDDILICRADRS